jgi:DNA-binding MarR family transcriptional regulator
MSNRPPNHHGDDNNGYPRLPGLRRLPPLLRRAWFALNQTFRQRLAPLDLTPDQFTVLRWITESSPKELNQRQLANLMTSDPNTITSILSRMEGSGLIKRKPHPRDRRAQLVHATETGRHKFDQAKSIALDLQAEILDAIPMDRRDAFLENLELVANRCQRILDQSKM